METIEQIRFWRERLNSLLEERECDFGKLSMLLDTRPAPSKAEVDADAREAAERHGNPADRAPEMARALVDSLIARQRLIAHEQAKMSDDLARLSANYPGLHEHLATEIALALGCSENSASRRLAEAEDLAVRLPSTRDAYYQGILTQHKVTAIRTETENLAEELVAEIERDVLGRAPQQTVPELRHCIRRAILRRDPEGANRRHLAAKARRRVRSWALPDGMAAIQINSSAPDIAAISECLTALGRAAQGPKDGRSSDQRQVDALVVDMCTDVLDMGSFRGRELPRRHRRLPQIRVTMPLDALLGGDTPCELAGYGPITAAQARQIAADGELTRLVCDPLSGVLLDYGRTVYRPPQALRDFVIARDRTCVAPGCRIPADRCEIDHVIPFPVGPTSADALAAACKHHHRAKDGGGHTLTQQPDGSRSWQTPLGTIARTSVPRLWDPPPLTRAPLGRSDERPLAWERQGLTGEECPPDQKDLDQPPF